MRAHVFKHAAACRDHPEHITAAFIREMMLGEFLFSLTHALSHSSTHRLTLTLTYSPAAQSYAHDTDRSTPLTLSLTHFLIVFTHTLTPPLTHLKLTFPLFRSPLTPAR